MGTPESPTTSTVDRARITTSGMWMIVYSLTGRLARFCGQIALAWLLLPEHIGLIGIANSISALVSVVAQFGLADVLVSRYRKFELWSGPGFWLSIVVGLFTAVVMLVVAVVSSFIYEDVLLGWILALMSVTAIISSLGILPFAKLRADMRFREVAIIQSIGIVIQMAGAVLFASIGFGVFCIACGRLLEGCFRTTQMMRLAGYKIPRTFSLRHSKYLLVESLHLYTQSLCNNVVLQSDYLLLGLFATKAIVGFYVMAYSLSVQAISMLALNLNTVLFSAFTGISDSAERLQGAFLRSSKILAFACAPICLLQVVAASPAVHLVLKPDWHGIVPLVQILSFGTAFRCASFSWEAMLKAQRKFSVVARFSVFAAVAFVVTIAVGCYLGGAFGCAIACAAYNVVLSPLQLMAALGLEKGNLTKIADLSLRSLTLASVAYGLAWFLAEPLRASASSLLELLALAGLGTTFYLGISYVANPGPLRDLTDVIIRMIRRKASLGVSANA